ncbi:Uncharacterised protein [Segatella oris]|uniref:Uncharacterized protein n=1 Tax=Segatella oris TaxID=28135 RepID=A0A448L4L5_9BACT|nr:Uncharacterised protein [Segatella oris]
MQTTFFDALKDGFSEKTTFQIGINFLSLTSHSLFPSRLDTLSFNCYFVNITSRFLLLRNTTK